MEARIFIFAGTTGTGKTEVAINYALYLHQNDEKVALLDFDVVKPYIRIRDKADILRQAGLEVLMPEGSIAFADMPIIPTHLYAWVADKSRKLVVDVGGDKQGSTALAQVMPRIEADGYEFILVVNPFRPFSKTVDQIKPIAGEVAFGAHTRFTHIVANPHLKEKSTRKDFLEGLEIVKQASKEMELPIKFVAVSHEYLKDITQDDLPAPMLPLQLFIKYPWEEKPRVNWIYRRG